MESQDDNGTHKAQTWEYKLAHLTDLQGEYTPVRPLNPHASNIIITPY